MIPSEILGPCGAYADRAPCDTNRNLFLRTTNHELQISQQWSVLIKSLPLSFQQQSHQYFLRSTAQSAGAALMVRMLLYGLLTGYRVAVEGRRAD